MQITHFAFGSDEPDAIFGGPLEDVRRLKLKEPRISLARALAENDGALFRAGRETTIFALEAP